MALDITSAYKIKAGVEGLGSVSRFVEELKRGEVSSNGLKGALGGLKGAIAGLGLAGLAVGFASVIKGSIDAADQLNKLAQKTGISVEELSKLQYVGDLADVSLEQVAGAAGKFSKTLGDAARGGKEQTQTLRDLGISVDEVRSGQLSLTEAMAQAADVIREMPDGWQKSDLAMRAFGKSGRELIPLLNSDIRGLAKELEDMGGVITSQTGAAAESFNDNMTRMRYINRAIIVQLTNELVPILNAASIAFLDAKRESTGLKDAVASLSSDNKLVEWAESGATAAAFVVDSLRLLIKVVQQVGDSFSVVIKDVETMGKLAAAANPLRGGLLFNMGEVKAALAERNKYVEDANKRMADRFNAPLAGDAVKKFFEDYRAGKYAIKGGAGGKPGGGPAVSSTEESEFDKALKRLQDQLDKTKELSVAEETLAGIERGRFGALSTAQRNALLAAASAIDFAKAENEQKKEAIKLDEDAAKAASDAARKRAEDQAKAAEKWRNVIDPTRELKKQLEEIDELYKAGKITFDEWADAQFSVNEKINEAINKNKDDTKSWLAELTDAVEGWGKTATDAFLDFATGAKTSFSDLIASMLRELAKMILYKNVFGPLFKWASSQIPGMFGFEDGGIMSPRGPLELRRYANGGVASSPQLALFGEGAQNEAFVPLPDGRSIPVSMRGGAGGNVNISIVVNAQTGQTRTQGDPEGGLRAFGERMAAAARGVIVEEQRPGGLLYGGA